jgi:hypothetical protein
MDELDSFLQSVAYKFPKGYPDMTDPNDRDLLFELAGDLLEEEKKQDSKGSVNVDEVKSLIDLIKDDKEALIKIKRFINNRPIENTFFNDIASQSNITDKTVDTSNAPKVMFNILSDNDDLASFAEFNKPSFSELPEQGNLLNFLAKSGISKDSLTKTFDFSGKESGRGVGRGEVGLALLFNDLKMASAGAGDLDWSGKSLEIKGSNARLGGRDRTFSNFKKTKLGQLAEKYDKTDPILKNLIPNLADEEGIDKDELLQAVIEFEDIAHPNGNAEKYITKDILDKPASLRKAFTKILIQNYTQNHNIDHFLWMNTNKNFGKYISFSPEEADSLVDKDVLRTNNMAIHQLDPSISKP